MVERINVKLGEPERCPHGWPIDTVFEQVENHELEPLSALEPGGRATIVRLAEHDGDLLHWFYDEGFAPGTSVEVSRAEGGTMTVVAGGATRSIAEKQASGLFVRRAA